MPYVPPHLRPGYIPTVIEKPDLTGRVHWPTNMDKTTNVIESSKVHVPHLGIVSAKSALKLTKPISQVEPELSIFRRKPSKFNLAVRRHIRVGSRKRKTTKHHKPSKKAKSTRRKTR
jgi:hypothetical protein